jgi:hypothetical protein
MTVTAEDVACKLIQLMKSGRTAKQIVSALNEEYEAIPRKKRAALIQKAGKIVQDKTK